MYNIYIYVCVYIIYTIFIFVLTIVFDFNLLEPLREISPDASLPTGIDYAGVQAILPVPPRPIIK